eukprot:scaffold142308_cov26-Tisochrysis_lutea.AAC.1
MPWKSPALAWLPELAIERSVRRARTLLHDDLVERWLTELPHDQRAQLDIATLLDPRFKTYKFPGLQSTNLEHCADIAKRSLEMAWKMDWKP